MNIQWEFPVGIWRRRTSTWDRSQGRNRDFGISAIEIIGVNGASHNTGRVVTKHSKYADDPRNSLKVRNMTRNVEMPGIGGH